MKSQHWKYHVELKAACGWLSPQASQSESWKRQTNTENNCIISITQAFSKTVIDSDILDENDHFKTGVWSLDKAVSVSGVWRTFQTTSSGNKGHDNKHIYTYTAS